MFCPNCGKSVDDGAHFCANCGKALMAKDEKVGLFLPTKYIVLMGLSLAALLSVICIPYLLFELNGRTYTMHAFTANEWPRQVDIARELELVCDIFILAILISSIFGMLFAFRKQAKYCLFSSISILAFSTIGFNVLVEILSPIENSGAMPIGFMVSFCVSLAMILISADIRSRQKRKKTKLRRLR